VRRAARRSRLGAGAALLLAGIAYALLAEPPEPPLVAAPAGTASPDARALASDDAAVERAFRERRSDLWVELEGRVEKTLADDLDGSRHQRFIVRLASGRTLLVAHNIDLAARVPLRRGDTVRLRGEYEWNERGGVVHWTHHDPAGRRPGGWIEHDGQRVR
jgi:hypothetical protein